MAAAIAQFLPDFSGDLGPGRAGSAPAQPGPRAAEGLAALLRKPSAPPETQEDRAALIRAAEAKGFELGRARGRAETGAEAATAFADLRAEHAAHLAAQREAWCAEEGDRLASGFADALQALGAGLTDRVGHLLVPVLTEALRRQAVDELAQSLARILGDARAPVRVCGPADLLDAVAGKLGPFEASLDFVPAETAEVTVQADQTVIETQLGAWGRLMTDAVRGA